MDSPPPPSAPPTSSGNKSPPPPPPPTADTPPGKNPALPVDGDNSPPPPPAASPSPPSTNTTNQAPLPSSTAPNTNNNNNTTTPKLEVNGADPILTRKNSSGILKREPSGVVENTSNLSKTSSNNNNNAPSQQQQQQNQNPNASLSTPPSVNMNQQQPQGSGGNDQFLQQPPNQQQQQQQQQYQQQQPQRQVNSGASEMVELALRAEVKRLREENLELRRAAERARALETEAAMLRDASVWQLDEKAPIKLRQLEMDNHRLRRKCQAMEERISSLEMERKTLAALGGGSVSALLSGGGGTGGGGGGASPGAIGSPDQNSPASGRRASPKSARNRDPLAGAENASAVAANAANFVCTNCRLKISVNNRAWQQRMDEVRKENTELKERLDAATNELSQIGQWVAHVVNIHNQYPSLAQTTGASHVASLLGGANEHLKTLRK